MFQLVHLLINLAQKFPCLVNCRIYLTRNDLEGDNQPDLLINNLKLFRIRLKSKSVKIINYEMPKLGNKAQCN